MRFLKSIALLAVLATACAAQPQHPSGRKFGAATSQVISATYDPSVSGLPGSVGDIVSVAGGASAWVKYGTGITDWRAFPGEAGGSGDGVVQAIVAGAGVLVDDTDPENPIVSSLGTDTVLLRAQALIPAANFDTVIGSEFDYDEYWTTSTFQTGAVAVSQTDKAGVVALTSGATANSFAIMFPSAAPSVIDNARTTPWYWYARFKVGAGNANAIESVGLAAISANAPANPGLNVGLRGAVSATNFAWNISNSGGTTLDSGTGPALDTSWHTSEVYNDGTTTTLLFDGVAFDTTPSTNLPTVPWMPSSAALNGATASARTVSVDKWWIVVAGN